MSSIILKRLLLFFMLLIATYILSGISFRLWGNKEERKSGTRAIQLNAGMTVGRFGTLSHIPEEVLIKIFEIHSMADTALPLRQMKLSENQILKRTNVEMAEYDEEHSKNPIRFTLHFILALIFMGIVFYIIRKMSLNILPRNLLYLVSLVIFGLGFNSNPSPMGPLKDTLSLLGNFPEIIHPRLFTVLTYLLCCVVANKFICGWACQFGVLQDLIFRLNRNKEDNKGLIRQFKVPFMISNTFRMVFFLQTMIISVLWAVNIIDTINPFAVFHGLDI